jgi:predicted TIM-barrel fold metal-dependent hydrolase
MLVTKATLVSRARYPVIDVHNHLGGGRERLTPQRVARYLEAMDATGVQTVVNLDGGWDERLAETLAALDNAHPGRFLTFALINFEGIDQPGWTERELKRLESGFKAGAKGLKIHKSLGLGVRDGSGRLVAVDDPRIDPLWELCGRYGRPVMIHTGDPGAFFTPLDSKNERWHELNDHPEWLFHGKDFPPRAELHAQRLRVIERHPRTTFICAHLANDAEDLATVGAWLESHPNMYVDIDARISELGRQPYSARRFLIKYQDRVMFGTDTAPSAEAYRMYFRFLETDDEYFDPAGGHHRQGFWMIYGVFLPDDVLAKLYNGNAKKILHGLASNQAAR